MGKKEDKWNRLIGINVRQVASPPAHRILAAMLARAAIEEMEKSQVYMSYGQAWDFVDVAGTGLHFPPAGSGESAEVRLLAMQMLGFYRLGRKSAGMHDMEG